MKLSSITPEVCVLVKKVEKIEKEELNVIRAILITKTKNNQK